jgi:hypothetical protein
MENGHFDQTAKMFGQAGESKLPKKNDTSVSFRLSASRLLHNSILSVIAIYAIVAV